MMLLLLLLAGVDQGPDSTPFRHLASFATPAACDARLTEIVEEARKGRWIAVEGPYIVAQGDRRIHMVEALANGHAITEHRCGQKELSTRTWRHSMGSEDSGAPETIESMAAKAEWLKKKD
jgi:hypothetical protein